MPLQANLQDISATQVLNLINLAGKTGMLTVYEGIETDEKDAMNKPKQKAGAERSKIAFRGGKLIYASVGGQKADLITVLNKAGKLSNSQARIIRERAKNSNDKALALLLINANYVSQNDIVSSIQQHTLDVVYNMLSWEDGPFRFDDNMMPSADRILVPIDLENVIIEASRRIQQGKKLLDEIPDLNVALRFPENPKEKFKGIHLSVEEWRVVSFVNPQNSVKQIAKANNMSDMEIRRVVYGLMMAGLVQIIKPTDGKVEDPSRPRPRPTKRRKSQVSEGVVVKLIDKIKAL
jgi:DNA-binding NarL/FixJ family response regulator